MKNVAISGLGRIGRLVLRQYLTSSPGNYRIVAANDLTPVKDILYLLLHDSVHRAAPFSVEVDDDYLIAEDQRIKLLHERDPLRLPWKSLGVDIVLECTGLFRKREDAGKHLTAGASKVLISATAPNADITIVLGVNEKDYDDKRHNIISNASCTTNSLATALKVLNDSFGVEHAMITTIHAYTSSQNLVDGFARKRRRGRAAALSLVPTTTGAATATTLVIPELEGKMDAIAIRVPIPDAAITDIVACVKKDVSVESVNEAFKKAAEEELRGILEYSEEELVSVDILGSPYSGIIDALSTKVVGSRMVKLLVWYDNEYGYTKRLLELSAYVADRILD